MLSRVKINKIYKYILQNTLNSDILKLLYFAFAYPHLLYGIEIYDQH